MYIYVYKNIDMFFLFVFFEQVEQLKPNLAFVLACSEGFGKLIVGK